MRAAMGMAMRTAHTQDVRGRGKRQDGWRRHDRLTSRPITVRHLSGCAWCAVRHIFYDAL